MQVVSIPLSIPLCNTHARGYVFFWCNPYVFSNRRVCFLQFSAPQPFSHILSGNRPCVYIYIYICMYIYIYIYIYINSVLLLAGLDLRDNAPRESQCLVLPGDALPSGRIPKQYIYIYIYIYTHIHIHIDIYIYIYVYIYIYIYIYVCMCVCISLSLYI